jgi:hypothetical protein
MAWWTVAAGWKLINLVAWDDVPVYDEGKEAAWRSTNPTHQAVTRAWIYVAHTIFEKQLYGQKLDSVRYNIVQDNYVKKLDKQIVFSEFQF